MVYLDPFTHITDFNFGSAWVRLRFIELAIDKSNPPVPGVPQPAGAGVAYNMDFPATAGGTPGFAASIAPADPTDGFQATSLPFRSIPPGSAMIATKAETTQKIKTDAGAGTIGFYLMGWLDTDTPAGFGLPASPDASFGWCGHLFFQPANDLELPLKLSLQSNFSSLGPPAQTVADISYFNKIDFTKDLLLQKPSSQAFLKQVAPPIFPTNTGLITTKGVVTGS